MKLFFLLVLLAHQTATIVQHSTKKKTAQVEYWPSMQDVQVKDLSCEKLKERQKAHISFQLGK